MVLSTVAAVASAALFAVTTNLQREAASSVPTAHGGPLHLVRRLVADPRWLLAGGIGAVALALHALALARGSVLVVQSVMALGLVIALSIEATREHRPLTRREATGALLVVSGVVTVVAICSSHGPATAGPALTLLSVGVVGATGLLLLRTRSGEAGRWAARALAAAAGACFAVDAVFLQRAAQVDGPPTVSTVVSLAGFLAASFVGGVAVHRAYQVAPLRSVQPALASAEPLTAFVIGVVVLQQGVRGGPFGYAVLVAGLALITVGIVVGLGEPRVVTEPVAVQGCRPGSRTTGPTRPRCRRPGTTSSSGRGEAEWCPRATDPAMNSGRSPGLSSYRETGARAAGPVPRLVHREEDR